MSNLKVQASPTGTGVVTLTAPTTNTDRTVTLPDTTGTLYISGGDIGTPSAGNGSNLTNLNASNLASGTVPDARFPATLPAASGANLTNLNASNLSTGTVGTARLATGTANSTTYLRGDQTWATVTSLPGAQGQVFTSSGTFTVPSGITAVKVTVVGGGGGAGSSRSPTCGSSTGGAGGGAGLSIKFVTGLTPGGTVSVTVGGAGAGGTPNNNGGTGGTSSFGAHCSATGGGGGGVGFNGTGSAGSHGTGSSGDINLSGFRTEASNVAPGMAPMFGGRNAGGNQAGINYGSGGTAPTATGGGLSGQAGSAGIVIVEW